jgi:serine/threonine protein kinase
MLGRKFTMPDAMTHPTPQELTAFGLGKLPQRSAAAVAAHLESCSACREAVAVVAPDSFLGQLRSAAFETSNTVPPHRTELTPTTPDAVPPELAASSKFEVLGKLGEGGMGAVWKARHTFLNDLVAIKVMKATSLANPEARGRFLREMQAVGQLKHKNIVGALDAAQMGELLVLVMEYVEGTTLDRLVAQKGTLPVGYSCHCIAQAAVGLQHAHEQGMVHRDIKPANLILARQEGCVKVLDFGLARGPREQANKGNQTRFGAVMGTPAFMAPEQASDASGVDIRADIYSLGCTLYFLLAGYSPFQRDSALATMMAQVGEEARPLPEVRPEVTAELWAVMARMLAKKPEERYQTPKEVEQALRPFVSSSAKAAQPGSRRPGVAADPGTLLPNDTRKLKPPPPPMTPPRKVPAKDQEATSFADLTDTDAAPKEGRRARQGAKSAAAAWWKHPGVMAAAASVFLGLFVMAAVIIKVMTTDGSILVIEVNEPNSDVFVDGEKVSVTSRDGRTRTEITRATDPNRVQVKKNGFTVSGRDLEVKDGKQILRVRLVRSAQPGGQPLPKPGPEKGNKPQPAAPPAGEKDGWVQLFNGKDLTGWNPAPQSPNAWSVDAEGILTVQDAKSGLISKRSEYTDFHLKAEVLMNWGACNSIQFRFAKDKSEKPAYIVQIAMHGDSQTGSLCRSTQVQNLFCPYEVLKQVPESPVPSDRWFTLEVIAVGDHIVVKVDGETTADVRDPPGAKRGHIVLTCDLLANHTLKFRKIEIKELPPPKQTGKLRRSPSSLPQTQTVDLEGGVQMGFVLIPKGKCTLGSPSTEKDRNPWPELWEKDLDVEKQHDVEITRPFYLA